MLTRLLTKLFGATCADQWGEDRCATDQMKGWQRPEVPSWKP